MWAWTSLRQKIIASYLLLILILSLVGLWSVLSFFRLAHIVIALTQENYRSVVAAGQMKAALERQDSGILLCLLSDPTLGEEEFRSGQTAFLTWLGREEDNITVPNEGALVAQINQGYQRYLDLHAQIATALANRQTTIAHSVYYQSMLPTFRQLRATLSELEAANNRVIVDRNVQARREARQAAANTGLGLFIVTVVALGAGWRLSQTIVEPTNRLAQAVTQAADGDWSHPVPIPARDEIGRLAIAFNELMKRLQEYRQTTLGQLFAQRQQADAIIRVIDDPVLVVDNQLQVILMNPAAELLFGVRERELAGQPLAPALPPGSEQIMQPLKKALAAAAAPQAPDEGMAQPVGLTIEGQLRYFDPEIVPLRRPDGPPAGLVVLFKDVTRFKELDEVKSEFVATVSHEFRTPLTTLTMGLELIRTSGAIERGSRNEQLLTAMAEDTHRLSQLVTDLLDLARLESGRIEMDFRSVPANDLVRQALHIFSPQAEEKGVQLEGVFDPDQPLVRADPNRVLLVVSNLLSNAIRYTPAAGQVRAEVRRQTRWALFSVSDTGPGIPPAAQRHLFEKFYQVPGRPTGAAGLGLAICREIVQAHGGRIWVESGGAAPGTTFRFSLPLVQGTASETSTDAAEHE